MRDKLYVMIVYAITGLVMALWPLWAKEKVVLATSPPVSRWSQSSGSWPWKSACLAVSAFGMIRLTGESVASTLILSLLLIALAVSITRKKFDTVSILLSFLALCVSATIPWWRRQGGSLDIASFELLVFALFTTVLAHVFTTHVVIKESKYTIAWLTFYSMIATLLSFSTGIFSDSNAFLTLWHHWGAYIGPAELLLTGAAIFHDFPAQYGLGPTALIASACANDCWRGMYFISGFTTLAFSVLIAVLALALSRRWWPERLIVLSLCLVICFFWAAYPPSVASPVMTPSVSGLRFLPAVLLVTYLFFIKQIEYSKPRLVIAHGFWVFGALWSPESAFYVTCVWWPYYIFLRRVQGDSMSLVKGIVRAAMKLLLIGAGLAIVFNIIFRIIYDKGPTLYGYLAYAINPPGPMPINIHGTVWYFLFASIIGASALWSNYTTKGDTTLFRRGFLLQFLGYGTFSYFLGRSHDNNLLNIMPFIFLILLHAMSTTADKGLAGASIVLTAALIGWLPLFGWQAWRETVSEGKLFSIDSKSLRESISFSDPLTQQKIAARLSQAGQDSGLPTDSSRAVDFLQRNYAEPITVLDFSLNLVGSAHPKVWSAIHGPANYAFIPSQRRQEFLLRAAKSLNRSGWLIVDRKFPADDWLADFDSAYQRTNRFEFGTYYAIRFSPKTSH